MMSEISSQAQTDRTSDASSSLLRLARGPLSVASVCVLASALALTAATPLPTSASEPGPDSDSFDELVEVDVGGVVSAPMERVRSVLLDLEGFPRWFPATGEWRVLERGATSALVHGRQSLPWPVLDRDYVVRYVWRSEPVGDFVLEASLVTHEGPEPEPGVVRVPYLWSQWRIRPHIDGTEVLYRYRGHPGGSLPVWVMRTGWRAQTGRVLDGLRDEVARVARDVDG